MNTLATVKENASVPKDKNGNLKHYVRFGANKENHDYPQSPQLGFRNVNLWKAITAEI
jgi:hypothetical protein